MKALVSSLGLALVLLVAGGCGRTSLIGNGGVAPDGGGGDQGGCDPACLERGCDQPGCCTCDACQSAPLCDSNGDMGGDPCADPRRCGDPVCVADPRCHVPGTEICNNGVDDNDDGRVDCADPQCVNFPGCRPHGCDPAHVDCADPACVDDPACRNLKCHPSVDFGTLAARHASASRSEDTTGTEDSGPTQCAPGGGGMVVGQFTLAGTADVTLSWAWDARVREDHVFALARAGVNQTCDANHVACVDPKGAPSGLHTFARLPAGSYYLMTQAYEPRGQGQLTVTLSTPAMREICNNGVDDNGNGLIDCADADCATAPNCVNNQCKPDFNLGALVVNAPGRQVAFDTRAANADQSLTCQSAKGGGDVVVRFTLQEPAGVLLDWSQSGDHVVGLFDSPAPGARCDSSQRTCYDPSRRSHDTVAFNALPPGDYELIFKATRPGTAGPITATIGAFRERPVELCHNGIDDDGNGLIDCADPACIGVEGCSGPYCHPDRQLGSLAVGSARTIDLDVAGHGIAGYRASCAQGGGKGMVVQFTVPSGGPSGGFGIGIDCQQSGDHVIDLFAAGGPRDVCDADERVCADPRTLPFGCGFEIPNQQPGTYNLVVEGFQPGAEGDMQLTVSIVNDRVLEICNNGIDDDGDGKIDCADRKCATSSFCSHAECHPDATVDPMPLTGAVVAELVQTLGAPAQARVPCAAASGVPTAVVALTLTAPANLQLEWNQLGNHDFALYSNDGTVLPCDAGSAVACARSGGQPTGRTGFAAVPAGRYYLVVGADTTAGAGSVALQLSGRPLP